MALQQQLLQEQQHGPILLAVKPLAVLYLRCSTHPNPAAQQHTKQQQLQWMRGTASYLRSQEALLVSARALHQVLC
jgi:hypothetical protein